MLRGLDIQVSGMQSLAKSYTPCCVLGHELLAVVPPQLSAKTIIGDITWDHRPLVSTHYPLHSTQRFLPKGEKILKTLLQQIYGPTLYSQHIQRHRLTFHFGKCWIKPSGWGYKVQVLLTQHECSELLSRYRFKHWEMTNVECTNYPVHYFTMLCWV